MSTSVFVLLPKKNLVFAVSAPALYEGLYAHRADLREVYRRLAYDLHRFWEGNDATIRRLVGAYRIGAVALVVEVAILVVAATGKLL